MSKLKEPIDLKSLENELDDAIRADELYHLRNSAKIRAVEQRVPTYEHFRDMVEAAHLRPLEKSEMNKRAEVSWNHCLKRNDQGDISRISMKDETTTSASAESEPSTSTEFFKLWKSIPDPQEKFEYLYRLRDGLKEKFFICEIPCDFLEEFIRLSLDARDSSITASRALDLLEIFKDCNRFSLTLAIISMNKSYAGESLFEKLLTLVSDDVDRVRVERIAKEYKIELKKSVLSFRKIPRPDDANNN